MTTPLNLSLVWPGLAERNLQQGDRGASLQAPGALQPSTILGPGGLGGSAPSFEELFQRGQAERQSPAGMKPTFSFSELGVFGLTAAVASRGVPQSTMGQAASSNAVPAPPAASGAALLFDRTVPSADAIATREPSQPLAGRQSSTTDFVGASTAARALVERASTSAAADAPPPRSFASEQTAGPAPSQAYPLTIAMPSAQADIEPLGAATLAELAVAPVPSSAIGMTAETRSAAPEAPSSPEGQAPSERPAPPNADRFRQAVASASDLSVVVAEQGTEAQVAVAAPALPAEAEARLRQAVDQVAGEFGLSVTELFLNGAALGRAPKPIGAQDAGRFSR